YKMVLDYQAKTLTLTPNGYKPGAPLNSMAMAMQLMNAGRQPVQVLSPAAQWGLRVRKAAGDDKAGVDVGEVFAGSAAAAAGLQIGDRLLTIDGRWTDATADVYDIAAHIQPGVRVPVVIRRGDKEMQLTVQPRRGM
ncbi:MAG: PDZ domain-containing protein, partial [Gemmataceae bacterium]